MTSRHERRRPLAPVPDASPDDLLSRVARGDEAAFSALYDELAPRVFGLCRRVLRGPPPGAGGGPGGVLEGWSSRSREDPAQGSAASWAPTIAPPGAADRVPPAQASTPREG